MSEYCLIIQLCSVFFDHDFERLLEGGLSKTKEEGFSTTPTHS